MRFLFSANSIMSSRKLLWIKIWLCSLQEEDVVGAYFLLSLPPNSRNIADGRYGARPCEMYTGSINQQPSLHGEAVINTDEDLCISVRCLINWAIKAHIKNNSQVLPSLNFSVYTECYDLLTVSPLVDWHWGVAQSLHSSGGLFCLKR